MMPGASEPTLSVVIGSRGPRRALEACLAALEVQRDGVEVLVCEAEESQASLRERFHWARFFSRPGALVPELWRDGIERSRGAIVALTISPMLPSPDWVVAIRAQHERFDAVAGAIEPGSGLRVSDWAEYFCRYARDMLPFEAHECLDMPGDNAAYKRETLESVRDAYRDGFWEPVVHRRLADEQVVLWHSPRVLVRQGRSAGWRAFARQRLQHGYRYGRQRGTESGRTRNLAGVMGAPIVPFLMSFRVLRLVTFKRRFLLRLLVALPFVFLFNVAWATGEARGQFEILRQR